MTRSNIVLFLLAIVASGQVFAQRTAIYTNDQADYQKALALYNNRQYLASQIIFTAIQKETKEEVMQSECAYYIASTAIRLNQLKSDELVEDFVTEYPTSPKRNSAYVDVANYYFKNGKYAHAKKWYDRVDERSLTVLEKDTYYFNKGYTAFVTKNYSNAQKYLTRVENSSEYGAQAKYYIGYMAYQSDDAGQANQYFDQVQNQAKYKEKLSYFKADLNFKLGNFEEAIALAKEQIPYSTRDEESELNKIIGESYFNLGNYDEAIPYLSLYDGKRGKWSNTDYYLLGYAYYKQSDYDRAISEFNKIISGNNGVAQNAYYHLGESYIKLNKKTEALNAFRNASQMEFVPEIQKDAWYNYAKISYDIGNPYESVPKVLSSYLTKYPETTNRMEVEGLLVDSYITSKNYGEALKLLESKKDAVSKEAYQKVAFYRGLELVEEENYTEALTFFELALKEQINPEYTARTNFWKGECNYNLNNYAEAITDYKAFKQFASTNTEEGKIVDYNLGYAYFKQKDNGQSTEYFNAFTQNYTEDQVKLNDAYLRLADGYFVSSKYSQAIKAYDAAINLGEIETDYAAFQKAISYGYAGDSKTKVSELEQFVKVYPKSKLRDDAMYELGNAYNKSNDKDRAVAMYNQLSSEYRMSSLTPKAMLREGLIFYNDNENQKAIERFKTVAANYPGSPEAIQAVSTARLIYIDMGEVDTYASWVKTLDYVNVTDADLDNSTYEAAEKRYLDNDVDAAIKQFNGYLNQFKNGLHANQAHFYLAQLYYSKGLKVNATPHYKAVVDAQSSEFTEEALKRLSQSYLDGKNWIDAIPVLERLESEATFPQNVVFAQSNLMKANYQLSKYKSAVSYAEKVLANETIDNKIKSDANIIIARSAFNSKDMARAQQAYEDVSKVATGETAAEALYYNAYFKHKDAYFEESNAIVQRLAKDYSSYKYYSAKGLVIMAMNYKELGDAFQATYILESVIENFKTFDDVILDANTQLSEIKKEQAKTNSSIQTQD
ncbi:TPR domain protein [Formosa agariphila KMM 3901]|uniref:TPR domain protein n=1 Tax=Formosa agariphila (strain DSM 15362 / KCTC 12365 / LMG 23005 / KMM 3901 / M-2Alg 35-1) TaxID=1347342 RepID=T2KP42_FORAG|nr:tetratricopeptide repeat protein [Formosa agariphila]CDF80226.1 TPR domain protein [Formosa agariphila KMM 3901]